VKVNASKDSKNIKREHKEGWDEANSRQEIYPVVSVVTKPPLVHIVDALHTRVLLPGHQVSPKSTTWLATKTCQKGTYQAPLFTLMLPPLSSFSTKRRGSPHHPHKVSLPLHTKSKGRRRLMISHLGSKASKTPCKTWSEESPHKVGTPWNHLALS
jgi:hypothetical protein